MAIVFILNFPAACLVLGVNSPSKKNHSKKRFLFLISLCSNDYFCN